MPRAHTERVGRARILLAFRLDRISRGPFQPLFVCFFFLFFLASQFIACADCRFALLAFFYNKKKRKYIFCPALTSVLSSTAVQFSLLPDRSLLLLFCFRLASKWHHYHLGSPAARIERQTEPCSIPFAELLTCLVLFDCLICLLFMSFDSCCSCCCFGFVTNNLPN